MPIHEFGIIELINEKEEYNQYCPEKYNCVKVNDDIILSIKEKLDIMHTYFHNLNRPEYGLAYYGITLIPPASLKYLQDVLITLKECIYSEELNELVYLITIAIDKGKYIIHFGI